MNRLLLVSLFCLAESYLNNGLLPISITRHHKGDIFIAQGEKCYKELCVSMSGGTAVPTGNSECECKCPSNRPVFRDDLNICVDDVQECSLVPFASGSAINKIPYVFLPLKGQIVYPSADIIISEVKTPVCVVSGGQFLGQNGWLNLRNNSSAETPFTLFRDEGKIYLQWLGEAPLRIALEGRIILVHLMCKDASATEEPTIFTPCIAFRVAGNPSVKEMMFTTDIHLKEDHGGTLGIREYAAIGVCSLLLAIVYAAAIFLYLHIRKRRRKGNKKMGEDSQLALGEEGVIKSNPLLQATRHLSFGGHDNAGYVSESNSCCSDNDQTSDLLHLDDEDLMGSPSMQTSAIIHPCNLDYGESITIQESNSIEKLPEENVSIVETLEVKENHPETVREMGCANGRRKLYFNPSYFEPDLLKAPPPAAMEFLMKIREVIALAKHKMSAKKFSPSLLGIPEEDGSSKADYSSALSIRKDISVVEKCETRKSLRGEKASGGSFTLSELCWPSDTKQKIIRKWLEDVPVMMPQTDGEKAQKAAVQENKILNKSTLWQMNQEAPVPEKEEMPTPPARQEKKKAKGRAPPAPAHKAEEAKPERDSTKSVATPKPENLTPPPRPPPMPTFKRNCDNVPRVQGKDCVPPEVAKNLMDAVIQELTNFKKNDKNSKVKELTEKSSAAVKGDSRDSAEHSEGQPEAKLTANEEPKLESSAPEVKISTPAPPQDDHEYEIILLNADPPASEEKDVKIYNLPEILSKNDRTEGYSLVSEVYVNDGYSCCSGESPPSSYSNMSVESDKVHYDTPNEKPGRLTIHVNDSPETYKASASESDNFEPDTLDRKPRKLKAARNRDDASDRYSNQRFHDMECYNKYNKSNKSENFTDSLERQSIMLKTNGTFKRNSFERDNDLLRNFTWGNVESVGSLREIYEAKSKSHKKRTETSSLIAMDNVHKDHDRMSTLSWSEERRNKLLHRGIVLHIREKESRKQKRPPKCQSESVIPPKVPSRPSKPCPSPRSGSGSASPVIRSSCNSPSPGLPLSPRSLSPPLPPPRSLPASPPPRSLCSPTPQVPPRSTSTSPVPRDGQRGGVSSPSYSPRNSIQRGLKNPVTPPRCPSPSASQPVSLPSLPFLSSPPPRPPKTVGGSPLLPPRNAKPPLPPKNVKRHPKPGKFAGRPLPPLPRPPREHSSSSPLPYRDPDVLSTHSGASVDSLNSSDYEAFYTLPYEEQEMGRGGKELPRKPKRSSSNAITIIRSTTSVISSSGRQTTNQRLKDSERKSWQGTDKAIPHRQEDSGYLSTDSDSCCPQLVFPPNFSRSLENGSQNSETEESLCDGASESGGESIATDSFFYGNFKRKQGSTDGDDKQAEVYPYSLRLSDVEVNSDTERHCIPIMVRP